MKHIIYQQNVQNQKIYLKYIHSTLFCSTFGVLARLLLRVTKCVYGDSTGYTCACLETAALKSDYNVNADHDQERKPILTASVQNYGNT